MSERDEEIERLVENLMVARRHLFSPHRETIEDAIARLRAHVDPPERVSERARSHHELPVIGPGSCPRCHTIVGADQVHVCATVSWRVGEARQDASALREALEDSTSLLEAISAGDAYEQVQAQVKENRRALEAQAKDIAALRAHVDPPERVELKRAFAYGFGARHSAGRALVDYSTALDNAWQDYLDRELEDDPPERVSEASAQRTVDAVLGPIRRALAASPAPSGGETR